VLKKKAGGKVDSEYITEVLFVPLIREK